MKYASKMVNLVLSGGGIKGIAYIGALEAAEKRGYQWANIAGVSAGALVGAFIGAGYRWDELGRIMDELNFTAMKMDDIPAAVPAVSRYVEFSKQFRVDGETSVEKFLNYSSGAYRGKEPLPAGEFTGQRGNFLKNLVTYSKAGCLLDGDYLEEWVKGILAKRGVRTFADLRGGIIDKVNPRGYRVRMTAVDTNRGKIITLPDDIAFYGIDPDRLEVARAVRMSTSVPFAFKPVEIEKYEADSVKTYHIVDGGVFDNFPSWLIMNSPFVIKIGFRLDGEDKKKLFSLDTPLNILKGLISKAHDIGIPKDANTGGIHVVKIDTSKVSFLDFDLDEKDKEYLYKSGKKAATRFFNAFEYRFRRKGSLIMFIRSLFRRRIF